MATKGTPGRMVRVDNETWETYGKVCEAEGTSRADDIRRHIHARVKRWRLEQRSATSPTTSTRPPAPSAATPGNRDTS